MIFNYFHIYFLYTDKHLKMYKTILFVCLLLAYVLGKCHYPAPVAFCGDNNESASLNCIKNKWMGNGNFCLADLPVGFALQDTIIIHGSMTIQNPFIIQGGKFVINAHLNINTTINIRGNHITKTVFTAKYIHLHDANIIWTFGDYDFSEYSKKLNLYCAHEEFYNYQSSLTVNPDFDSFYDPSPKLKTKSDFNINHCPGEFVGYKYNLSRSYKTDTILLIFVFVFVGLFLSCIGSIVVIFFGLCVYTSGESMWQTFREQSTEPTDKHNSTELSPSGPVEMNHLPGFETVNLENDTVTDDKIEYKSLHANAEFPPE